MRSLLSNYMDLPPWQLGFDDEPASALAPDAPYLTGRGRKREEVSSPTGSENGADSEVPVDEYGLEIHDY